MLRSDVNRLKRLTKFLDGFAGAFVRGGQIGNAQRYVRGLLSDAKRKNMEGMLQRLSDPGQYQTLQHFITHSTWEPDAIWGRLREQMADRRGLLLIDDTSIPKQGRESAGVARQYCGAAGKIANCQVIVTAALRSKRAVWPLAMSLFLGEEWCQDEDRRERARIPTDLRHRTKIEMAIEQIDLARAARIEIECVLADAGYGDASNFRAAVAERGLRYAVGVSRTTMVFVESPRFAVARAGTMGRPRTRRQLAKNSPKPMSLEKIAAKALGKDSVRKYYLSNLSADIAAKKLVAITHERWAVEQHYRDLKQETALDHFEGRSYPGLNRHMALTALAYTFLEAERQRSTVNSMLSIGAVREAVTEVVVLMLFALGDQFAKRAAAFIRDPPKL